MSAIVNKSLFKQEVSKMPKLNQQFIESQVRTCGDHFTREFNSLDQVKLSTSSIMNESLECHESFDDIQRFDRTDDLDNTNDENPSKQDTSDGLLAMLECTEELDSNETLSTTQIDHLNADEPKELSKEEKFIKFYEKTLKLMEDIANIYS